MAAGMGSRYGGTKQLDTISDEGDIIMDFSLFDAYRAGFKRAVFVIKEELEEEFRAHTDKRAGRYFETYYVFQNLSDLPEGFSVPEGRVKPWGTAHAVLAARDIIDAPFAVINADDYYGAEAFREIYGFLSTKADESNHCMIGFKVENTLSENGTVARGICNEYDGFLADVEEHTEIGYESEGEFAGEITGIDTKGTKHVIEEGTPVSMNLWGFGKEFIESLKRQFYLAIGRIMDENPLKGEVYLPSCIDNDIKSGSSTVSVLMSDEKWFGVTYKEDKVSVVEELRLMKTGGIYPKNLWEQTIE